MPSDDPPPERWHELDASKRKAIVKMADQPGVLDRNGNFIDLRALVSQVGLSRRQGLQAMALIAGGATIGNAIMQSMGVASAAASESDSDGDVGQTSSRVDVFADGVDANSVTTDDVFNSSIGDSVDYADPRWLAFSDAVYFLKPTWDTIDGVEQTTSGSASISLRSGFGDVQYDTGSTSSSKATGIINSRSNQRATYDNDAVLTTVGGPVSSTTDVTAYATRGNVEGGNQGFGFKIASGELQGVVHNGTSETTTTLIASGSYGTGTDKLRAEFTAGSDVTFFVNDTQEGSISSGLPSGTSGASVLFAAAVENSASSAKNLFTQDTRMVQIP